MHSTKSDILALLKRSDGATVDELASSLALAPMTVRQHLIALERDDLVHAAEVRRPTGRPHYLYRLTADGHRRVADGHDRMVALLVEQAGRLEPADVTGTPDARRARLFRRAAEALAERHRAEVRGLPRAEQAERVVALLRSYGGFAEWHPLGDGLEFRDFGCVFRSSVGSGMPCEWHETFLSAILEAEVRAAAEPDGCASCCRYVIEGRAAVPAVNPKRGDMR